MRGFLKCYISGFFQKGKNQSIIGCATSVSSYTGKKLVMMEHLKKGMVEHIKKIG